MRRGELHGAFAVMLAAAVVAGAHGARAGDGGGITLEISGAADAVVRYTCDFTGGGSDDGQVRPPFQETWIADGVTCAFEQVDGHKGVEIALRAAGSVSRVHTAGRGSRVTLNRSTK